MAADVPREDRALLEAHAAGDPDAFAELFTRHRDRLWAVALRTTGHPEEAADALQDALISAYRRADTFRGDAAVTTWLHRIVVNACLDRLRRAKVRAADPLPDDLEERAARGAVVTGSTDGAGASGSAWAGGSDSEPEAHVLAADRRDRVRAALEQLPPEQRAALVLVDMEGYPVAEAAAILEVPTGTVKSRCSRGRARLAVLLADLGLASTVGGSTAGTEDPSSARTGTHEGTGRAPHASHPGGPAPPRAVPGVAAPAPTDQPTSTPTTPGGERP